MASTARGALNLERVSFVVPASGRDTPCSISFVNRSPNGTHIQGEKDAEAVEV